MAVERRSTSSGDVGEVALLVVRGGRGGGEVAPSSEMSAAAMAPLPGWREVGAVETADCSSSDAPVQI